MIPPETTTKGNKTIQLVFGIIYNEKPLPLGKGSYTQYFVLKNYSAIIACMVAAISSAFGLEK